MIITNGAANHLLGGVERVPLIVKKFKDGEIYVRVLQKVKGVTVIAGFPPPAENFLELIFLLDALHRLGVNANLVVSYFGYARQDRVSEAGEAVASEVILNIMKQYVRNLVVVDVHNERLRRFLPFENVIPITPFMSCIPKGVVVVAPDEGAVARAGLWSKLLKTSMAVLKKRRPSQETAEVLSMEGRVSGRDVLIVDDMICTGGTVVEAAKFLMKNGAKRVFVAATHGIFAKDALSKLQKAKISRVFVTNTLRQKKHPLLKVIPIDGVLREICKKFINV